MKKRNSLLLGFFEALSFLNPDFTARNQNLNIEKQKSQLRKIETERAARAEERRRTEQDKQP